VAIQFEYCFPIIGLCIDIYEYGMLSMGFDNNSLIRLYESGTSPFRNSKRSLHLVKFLNINSSEFSEIFAHNKYFSNGMLSMGFDCCLEEM
jgi:hypothetical protein